MQHTFFVHFFAVVLHDYNEKLPETSWLHVLWRECRTCSCSVFFFFHCRSFLPWWPLAFPIFSPPLQNCHVALLSLFLCLSLSLYNKFVDMTVNYPAKTDVSPRSSPLRDVSRGVTSATQRQNSILMT